MAVNDLFHYMRDATHEMQSDYNRIQLRATEDPGTAGDNGEESWANLLKKWLPAHYHIVTKGRILNIKGECSPQVDVLVLSPSYPLALLNKKEYLEGGVLAAFECKTTLKAEHIKNAVETAAAISRLSPDRSHLGTPRSALNGRIIYGLLAHSYVWQNAGSKPIDIVTRHLRENGEREVNSPREILDILCVSDLAIWTSMKLVLAPHTLTAMQSRYEPMGMIWKEILKSQGAVEALISCASRENQPDDASKDLFTPIGCLFASLLKKLAWEDPSLRSLSKYFSEANLEGSAAGEGKVWPLDILPIEISKKVITGTYPRARGGWDDWGFIY